MALGAKAHAAASEDRLDLGIDGGLDIGTRENAQRKPRGCRQQNLKRVAVVAQRMRRCDKRMGCGDGLFELYQHLLPGGLKVGIGGRRGGRCGGGLRGSRRLWRRLHCGCRLGLCCGRGLRGRRRLRPGRRLHRLARCRGLRLDSGPRLDCRLRCGLGLRCRRRRGCV